jgi:F-type H+-transporting ATPase subunit a
MTNSANSATDPAPRAVTNEFEADEAAFKPLTREEAQKLRETVSLLSPWSVLLSVINIDSAACFLLWKAARKATSGVPGRFQAAVEILVEMVDAQAKGIVHNANSRKLVAPLALTVFVWIFLMNAMDLLPVDLLPVLWAWAYGAAGHDAHHAYMRSVPTADLSITMGLSLSVLLVCLIYNVKIKGVGGWIHELFTAPFGNPLLWPLQLPDAGHRVHRQDRLARHAAVRQHVCRRTDLPADRPDGRRLVAVGTGIGLAIGHIIAGSAWAIFHILIITLQAFVFMMLTLVYIGQAHDAH